MCNCYSGKCKRCNKPNETLKTDDVARYYYHITKKDWGKSVVLKPLGGNGGNRGSTEPSNVRTCVAPSIPHCLSAICFYDSNEFNVYRTDKKVKAKHPYMVPDSPVTKEKWIIEPQKFVLVAKLDIEKFHPEDEKREDYTDNDSCGNYEDAPHQRKLIRAWKEYLKSNRRKGLKRIGKKHVDIK